MTDNQPTEDTPEATSAPVVLPDQSEMTPQDLARAILARQIRPRITSVRRLAEALLAKGAKKGKKKAKKADKKVRKLAKIPGQKAVGQKER
jgi:hypothetical protein